MTTKISDLEAALAGVVSGVSELRAEDLEAVHVMVERALLHVVLERHLRMGLYVINDV